MTDAEALKRRLREIHLIKCPQCREAALAKLKETTR